MSLPVPSHPHPMRRAAGADRAALVLLALGETHGAAIWKEFDDQEIAVLGEAMARLGAVEQAHLDAALTLFSSELSATAGVFGTPSAAEALIARVLPEERAAVAMERLRRPSGPDPWEQLARLDDRVIAGYLASEHPQTIALVLSRLPAERAATILRQLDRATAIGALSRLARLDDADREAMRALEKTLADGLIAPNAGPPRVDPALRIASIFDTIDPREAVSLIDGWREEEAELATRVRTLMFTFEDFRQTPAGALQSLLRGIDRDVLALALKGASDEVRTRFLDQMSARAARMIDDQIAARGPVRRKDVASAQARIVSAARELEAAGELSLRAPDAGGGEDMVE